jgi:hypothetical protein
MISEYIVQKQDTTGNSRTINVEEWSRMNEKTLDVLGMETSDIIEWEEEFIEAVA